MDDSKTHLLVDDGFGIYVPQHFVRVFGARTWNIAPEDEDILLSGPDHEQYWETWDHVLATARMISADDSILGGEWTLYQDGDLWAVHESMDDEDWEELIGL